MRIKWIATSLNYLAVSIISTVFMVGCRDHRNDRLTLTAKGSFAADNSLYTESMLEKFLDSIAGLSLQPLQNEITSHSDSLFKNIQLLKREISDTDFLTLRAVANKGSGTIDSVTARRLFPAADTDSVIRKHGHLPLTFFSFDAAPSTYTHYAFAIGNITEVWTCNLFFFYRKTIVASQFITHKYGPDFSYFKDRDGNTTLYYREIFESGTGIWQFNYFFYKYLNGQLLPVLNVAENSNQQAHWGNRIFWMESTIEAENPLRLKLVFYQELYNDTTSVKIIDDSATVDFYWDEDQAQYRGNFAAATISEAQIQSYFLGESDLLFIRAYYPALKAALASDRRPLVLSYLKKVKKQYFQPK